jgi:hypothetical protein
VFRFGVLPRFRIRRGERIINFDQLLFAGVSCFGKNRRSAEGLGGSGIVSGPDERLAFRYLLAPCFRRVVRGGAAQCQQRNADHGPHFRLSFGVRA